MRYLEEIRLLLDTGYPMPVVEIGKLGRILDSMVGKLVSQKLGIVRVYTFEEFSESLERVLAEHMSRPE